MLNTRAETDELYIVAFVDENDKVIGFPTGGGSSTKPSIKAHSKLSSAKRSSKHFSSSVVVKVTGFEVVKSGD